jgi:flagellar M-ring protein FliF
MADRLRVFFKQFVEQSKIFYAGLTTGRKISIAFGVFLTLFVVTMFLTWKPEVKYETVFQNLSHEDKTAILSHLKKENIADFKMDGDSLSVPENQVLEFKMMLAQEGLPSAGVGVGWEKFDERTFGMSDFDQKVNKIRALQGELARSINKLEPVESSRVHIVLPENAVFADEKKPTTASIFLKLKRGQSLSKRQTMGIVHLVARAVEGLDPKSIAVVDQDGNMLTDPEEQDGGIDKITSAQRDYQKRVEKELEGKIRELITRVVGYNKVVSKVQAEIEFKKVETTISDVDPERTAVIASQRNEQSSQGNGLNPTGVPGAKSNLPGEKEDLASGGGLSNSTKSNTENLNFEVKKTLSKITEPIEKLSASVLVDGKMVSGKFVPRTKEEMEMITKLVKNSIGFQENRDSLTVENAQFELDEVGAQEKQQETANTVALVQTILITLVAIAAMVFVYLAFVRPYFRWLTHDPEKRSKDQFAFMEYDLERSGVGAKRMKLQEEIPFDKLPPKEQILYLAKHDPKKTTEAIRQFINPNSSV